MTGALHAYEHWVTSYKRLWRASVVSSILNPVLYLAALGVGLGKLVNHGAHPLGVSYVTYVAPGMLVAAGMNIAAFESTWPVMAAMKWTRVYHAMLAAPLRVRDVVVGHQLYFASRVAASTGLYLIALAAFGTLHSPYALLAWPVAVLVGVAFSAPLAAFAAWAPKDSYLAAIFRFGVVPLFLFSGTFFPVTRLPQGLRELAYATPLWHGVDLARHLTLGTVTWGLALAHVAYLAVFAAAGLWLAERSYTRRLVR
ncbi:MAG TPA: ABC transporter permease [Gaiellaceae bacterium]|nr:ABC transporter permease [Gaiellaceae bacterium]